MSDLELPAHLVAVRDAPEKGPSSHTIERRKARILLLETEQGEIFALMEDLQRIRDHVNSAPVVGKTAIPWVSRELMRMRQELGRQVEANRDELTLLRSRT